MATNSTLFAGNSRYANDFSSVISRAVAIASLPKAQLESQKSTLQAQSSALSALDGAFTALRSALTTAENSIGLGSFSPQVANSDVVTATLSEGVMAGSYSVTVNGVGSYTTALGATPNGSWLQAVSDPASESFSSTISSFTLDLGGGDAYEITGSSLTEIAESINTSGAAVRATVVNVGPPEAADYRLSLESTNLGPVSISLSGVEEDLTVREFVGVIGSVGSLASYEVGGVTIESDSRSITLAPGLQVELQDAGSTSITVERSSSALSGALSGLVNVFNGAMAEIDKHRGEAGGALAGDMLLADLGTALRTTANYAPDSGPFAVLEDIGISLDDEGKLAFDSAKFTAAASEDLDAVLEFIGGAETGGFLKAANDALTELMTEETGTLDARAASLTSLLEAQDSRIEQEQERVDNLTTALNAQMAAADAMIAMLEQQALYFTNMFAAQKSAQEAYS